jgi:hypothetical protein
VDKADYYYLEGKISDNEFEISRLEDRIRRLELDLSRERDRLRQIESWVGDLQSQLASISR